MKQRLCEWCEVNPLSNEMWKHCCDECASKKANSKNKPVGATVWKNANGNYVPKPSGQWYNIGSRLIPKNMAGKASIENGKKGGRPKGYAALEAERQRELIAVKLSTQFEPIINKAIEQAIEGNKDAREWLVERAYGKVKEVHDVFIREQAPLE